MTGLEPAIPRSEVWCLIHLATQSYAKELLLLGEPTGHSICFGCDTSDMLIKYGYSDKVNEQLLV